MECSERCEICSPSQGWQVQRSQAKQESCFTLSKEIKYMFSDILFTDEEEKYLRFFWVVGNNIWIPSFAVISRVESCTEVENKLMFQHTLWKSYGTKQQLQWQKTNEVLLSLLQYFSSDMTSLSEVSSLLSVRLSSDTHELPLNTCLCTCWLGNSLPSLTKTVHERLWSGDQDQGRLLPQQSLDRTFHKDFSHPWARIFRSFAGDYNNIPIFIFSIVSSGIEYPSVFPYYLYCLCETIDLIS